MAYIRCIWLSTNASEVLENVSETVLFGCVKVCLHLTF